MEVGWFSTTFQFRGRNADNNRFLAGRISGFLPLRLDYQALEVEDFTRGMDKWRREQLELLAGGKEEYALSREFIGYAEAFFQYEWAERMITYPAVYRRVNREENREITAEYFGFLKKVPLVDEKAIGVENYRPFLVHALDRVLEEAPPPSRLSDQYDFSRSGLSDAAEARLDSLYENRTPPAFSQQFDLGRFGLSEADGNAARLLFRQAQQVLRPGDFQGDSNPGDRYHGGSAGHRAARKRTAGVLQEKGQTVRGDRPVESGPAGGGPGPGSTRYMPIPTRNGGGVFRNDTTWPERGWRGECSTGFEPGS